MLKKTFSDYSGIKLKLKINNLNPSPLGNFKKQPYS